MNILRREKNKKIPDINLDSVEVEKQKNELPVVVEGFVRHKKKYERLGYWNKRRLKHKPTKSFLIRMNFSNGTSKEFVIATNKETFDYMKKTYYLRYEDSWFNLTQNQYELNYFDDFPVPLDRTIIKKGDKAYWSVTSENLKPIIKMEYVKALASSQEIDRYLKMNATISLVLLFLMFVMIYFLFKINKAIALIGAG